jgi:transketolase
MPVVSIEKVQRLRTLAYDIRRWVIEMTYRAGSGHPGGSLSAAEILTVLYFHEMRLDPEHPRWPDRDRFVLSKGHAAPAYYAALALRGFFPIEELYTLRKIGSRLQGHPSMDLPGVDMSTGSLGQGLGVGVGMALAGKLDKRDYRVYVLLGDGELHEGSVWEAAMSAAHHSLDNLVAIVDRNMIQLDGPTEEILRLESLEAKWRGFGWHVVEINGHDVVQIMEALEIARNVKGRPTVIIARTIKGKGVSYMENTHKYHGKPPRTEEEYRKAIEEIEEARRKVYEEVEF